MVVGRRSEALLESRLRCFIALQHTSIDVYAYVACRTKIAVDVGASGKCA